MPKGSTVVSVTSSIDELLTVMVERNASDLHLTAGSPPVIRVTGRLGRLPDHEQLTPEEIRTMMHRILSTEQQEILESSCACSEPLGPGPEPSARVKLTQMGGAARLWTRD